MKGKQLPIPGLQLPKKEKADVQDQLRSLQDRVLRLELELSMFKQLLMKRAIVPKDKEKPGCYFWSNDRCLGRPADTCPWSVKVGDWEWLCAYPWKGE